MQPIAAENRASSHVKPVPISTIERVHRRSTRLKGWDYASAGWYFVTICTQSRLPYFGTILHGDVRLNALGRQAGRFWLQIPQHIPRCEALDFVIMPNHLHGILHIRSVGALHATPLQHSGDPPSLSKSSISPKAGSLGAIIRSYKSGVTGWAHKNDFHAFAWQRGYYEHIVRGEDDLHRIRQYFHDTPHLGRARQREFVEIGMRRPVPPRVMPYHGLTK